MFEARLSEGLILKKIVESIKDIVTDVNLDVSPSGKATHPMQGIIFGFQLLFSLQFAIF
jgi:hypothetical protein